MIRICHAEHYATSTVFAMTCHALIAPRLRYYATYAAAFFHTSVTLRYFHAERYHMPITPYFRRYAAFRAMMPLRHVTLAAAFAAAMP